VNNPQPRVIVFAREPVPGEVKTRLIPALGADGAAQLYARLLETSLTAAATVENARVELWYDAAGEDPAQCRSLAERFGATLHRQPDGDLGERMRYAFSCTDLSPAPPAVLIGSDCPGYDTGYLTAALTALHDRDAVLGPAQDGGYVLIGLRRLHPSLFDRMPWGTGDVARITRSRLRSLQWRWTELPVQRDIDRPSDLAHFPGTGSASLVVPINPCRPAR